MLGKFWRSSKVTCQYPEHSGDKKYVRGRAGVNLEPGGFGWELAAPSLKPLPYCGPKYVIFPTIFQTLPKIRYTISDLPKNSYSLCRRLRRTSNFRNYSKHTSQEKIIIKN